MADSHHRIMQKATLGLLAVLVLFAGVLTHATTDVFAVVDKKSVSATEKSAEDAKIKAEEKTKKDDSTSKNTDNKSVGKTTKSMGKHNNKITATKVKRGLAAQKSKP